MNIDPFEAFLNNMRDEIKARQPENGGKEEYRSLFKQTLDSLFSNVCRPLEEYSSYSKRMSKGQRMVILVWALRVECANGGISQFLTNSAADDSEETKQALHLIGATKQLRAFAEIENKIFSGPIPKNRKKRMKYVWRFEGDMDTMSEAVYERHEEESSKFYREIDSVFGWCEELEEMAEAYIKNNPSEFDIPPSNG